MMSDRQIDLHMAAGQACAMVEVIGSIRQSWMQAIENAEMSPVREEYWILVALFLANTGNA